MCVSQQYEIQCTLQTVHLGLIPVDLIYLADVRYVLQIKNVYMNASVY